MADIIVAAVLIVLIGAAIYKVVSDRKKGIGSCGHRCDGCSSGCSTTNVPDRFKLKK